MEKWEARELLMEEAELIRDDASEEENAEFAKKMKALAEAMEMGVKALKEDELEQKNGWLWDRFMRIR